MTRMCGLGEVPDDDMASFFVETYTEVLVVRDATGILHAFDGICPHEDFPLVEGLFDGGTITCANHGWIFNASNGRGINPSNCRISEYPIEIRGDDVFVDLDAELPPPEVDLQLRPRDPAQTETGR